MHDAVFPNNHHTHPLLCRLVADHYNNDNDKIINQLTTTIELIHCTSLIQNDLPYFNNTATHHNLPTYHIIYGKTTAILVDDALLTLAFETLTNTPARHAPVAFQLMGLLTSATGSSHNVIDEQTLELEPHPMELEIYHRHKTTALFHTAAADDTICYDAETNVPHWARVDKLIDYALQLHDDMDDIDAATDELDKPTNRNTTLNHPNTTLQTGLDGTQTQHIEIITTIHELLNPPTNKTKTLHQLIKKITHPTIHHN